MKKTVALFLSIIMMTAVFICAKAESGENIDTENNTEITEETFNETDQDDISDDGETDDGTETVGDDDTETVGDDETDPLPGSEPEQITDADIETEAETEEGTAPDHTHEIVYVPEIPATCTVSGFKSFYRCEICLKAFFDEEGKDEITDGESLIIEPTGHNWGPWKTISEPDTFSPGMERRICRNTQEEPVLTVTLDAGHGKYDNKGIVNGYYEGRMTFTLMSYLKAELEEYAGIVVYTTRETMDDEIPLAERGKMAAENGSDLFISIHSNWFTNPDASGVSVYRSFIRPESEKLGALLGAAVTNVMNKYTGITYMRNDGKPMTRIEKAKSEDVGDGVNQDYYNVIRSSVKSEKCRYSFIIEHGFHSNATECTYLMSDENLKKLAVAEAAVIVSYFNLHPVDSEPLTGRHAEYRQIAPKGIDGAPLVYDIPDGFTVDASNTFPGCCTVTVNELEDDALEGAVAGFPNYRIVSGFDISAELAFCEVSAHGKIHISFPMPDKGEDEYLAALIISSDGVNKVTVTENEESKTASLTMNSTGVCLIYLYDASTVTENDVNGDGSFDNKDVVVLFRYVSGGDVYVEKLVADICKDGYIDNKDVVSLFRLMSNINK